jgi:peptidoglycan/LPS O-acetylase OafA/YrhL
MGAAPAASGLFRVFGWGLPACLIVASSLWLGPPRTRFARLLHLLGNASYAIYLLQVFALLVYDWLLGHTGLGEVPQAFIVPLAVMGAGVLGILAHLAIERPLITALRRGLVVSNKRPGFRHG